MRIVSARLRNFRCFSSLDLDFESPVVLIHGPNGSGKTSILEALHYACYLKSFKTHLPRDIIRSDTDGFALNVGIAAQGFDTLQVQFNRKKKTVKLNEKNISSYKELYSAYRVVTITEGDLDMVQGAPSSRRSFLDTVVLLLNPSHAALAQKYRAILNNRNALLAHGRADHESYLLWTDQLLQVAQKMQIARIKAVELLENEAHVLVKEILGDVDDALTIEYSYARTYGDIRDIQSGQDLLVRYPGIKEQEFRQKRSLFGAHLDDCKITYLGKACRTYSSRGQQKLVVFLLKMAQLLTMKSQGSSGTILLVDDFMTDFDDEKASALLPMMTKLSSQVILTSPVEGLVKNKLPENAQSINLATRVLKNQPKIQEATF